MTAPELPRHLAAVTAVLPDRFTASLTPDQAADATRVFSHIAATYTPDLALTWLTGQEPFLGDACPLTAIRDGHTADVWRAAHNLTHTTATATAVQGGA